MEDKDVADNDGGMGFAGFIHQKDDYDEDMEEPIQ